MFDDDEENDYLGLSQAELWFDDNMRYFYREEGQVPQFSLEVELFYQSVFLPFATDLKKQVPEMVYRHYPYIASETRPEILAKIDHHIHNVGHEFILLLHRVMHIAKLGIDLHIEYPELDHWAVSYPAYRKPNYTDPAFWDRLDELSEATKEELIAKDRQEVLEAFERKEKPRSEFFALLQTVLFKYYPEVQNIDSDGWTLYEVFLHEEYTLYRYRFEYYEAFIQYGFEVADLNLPDEEYNQMLSQRFMARREEELRQEESEKKDSDGESE